MSKNKLHLLTRLYGVELFEANETRQSYGKHAHGGFAIGSIILGVGGYWCRGTHHVLPRRTLTLMNPDEPHTGYSVSECLQYKMLYVSEEAVGSLLDTGSLHGFSEINPADRANETAWALQEIAHLLNQLGHVPAAAMRIDELVISLLAQIFQNHGRQELRSHGRESHAIRRIAELIDAHVGACTGESLTIGDLAAEVGLNPNYMIQSFSAARGISPHAYLIYRKICRAKTMIAGGMRSLDVALELGFYDQAHFIRSFRKVLGITPSALVVHASN